MGKLADGCTDAFGMRWIIAQLHANPSAHAHSYTNPNADADADSHSHTDPNTHAHSGRHTGTV